MKIMDGKTSPTIEELEKKNAQLENQMKTLELKVQWYEEQFRLAQQKRFGVSSEKTDDNQLTLQLFNEAEISSAVLLAEPTMETINYTRKKIGGRAEKLKDLPVETIHYDLSDAEKVCLACNHELHEMSHQTRQELKVVPAQVKVVEHVQHIYSCRHCEKHAITTPIVKAKMPNPVIPKGLASPSAIAFVMTQKFADGLPLYRQEKQLERMGIPLNRQTLSNWMISSTTRWLRPFYDLLHRQLLQEELLHADETSLQVLDEPGKIAQSKSYMWLYRTSSVTKKPMVLFDYRANRSSKNPKDFLKGYEGYLNVDGYAGYESLENVELAGCWAHARRKFDEALKALKSPSSSSTRSTIAKKGLNFCNQLFAIERKIKKLDAKERLKIRQKDSQPVLDAYLAWLHEQKEIIAPQSATGKAITYSLNQWHKLTTFMKDGRIEIDNNRAERSIKPFVIGRKNWLFAVSTSGANSSAIIYSLVETAKENGLNPFFYLQFLFEELPQLDMTADLNLEHLMPWSKELPKDCYIQKKK
ncbi:IS66 family transposase [Planococcus halocryophilus]|uniref:Transposase n=1 Tax=Planococcus halocryophilus TaxID=1215089 RepID=A0A1C7DVJ0_9BACL|nr:IS66 family transposase [Planococcus halocryophilus]ANU13946.1 transposase [Planococcus halocryophilus]ANU15233.1 transposase [Planococcus halocryophilus]ANU15237.1 transposase [Planococcus halocryophilus]